MPEGEGSNKGIGGFLNKDTAGIPNWGWLLIIAAGIAAAYFLPKILGTGGTSQQTSTSGSGAAGGSGLGLAIDPTTGLPYAVEGLVPSGGTVGTYNPAPPPPTPPVVQPPPPVVQPPGKPPDNDHIPVDIPPGQKPPQPPAKYVFVQSWPVTYSTLADIASHYGISLQRIEQLNPSLSPTGQVPVGTQVTVG